MDQKKVIITINRECGSGGGEIARLLAEKLGFKVYNRVMLEEVAKQFDITPEAMDRIKAKKNVWWDDFCRFYQGFGAASYNPGEKPEATPMTLYYAEARLLRELAEEESCIIIGRAAFNIFRDDPNAFHVLIMADRDKRIARIAKKQNLSNEEAAKVLDRIDKERDTFVNNVASTSRFDAHNYDIVLNVTDIEPGKAVDFLCEIIQNRFA